MLKIKTNVNLIRLLANNKIVSIFEKELWFIYDFISEIKILLVRAKINVFIWLTKC